MATTMAKSLTLAMLLTSGDAVKLNTKLKYFSEESKLNPVAEVVNLLKEMQSKSKADGAAEANLWATFKGYCEDQDRSKTTSITDLKTDIALLKSRIEELLGTKKRLEKEIAELAEDLNENADAQKEALAIRKKTADEHAEEKDGLETYIEYLEYAVETLSTVQDEHTVQSLLLSLGSKFDKFRKDQKRGFLQVPTKHEAQSGAVFGLLESTLDTTRLYLEEALAEENKSIENHKKLMDTLTSKEAAMTDEDTAKKAELADTANELAAKQAELETDSTSKKDDETFHENLIADCKEKTRINNERVELRRGEEEAIQTALEILDSDRAAKTFKKVGATSFLQTDSLVKENKDAGVVMTQVLHLLRKASHETHSSRLAEVAALSIPRNPFNRVMKAITEMKAQIGAEEKADKKQFDLCKKNRAEGADEKAEKEEQIGQLEQAMHTLETTMKEPQNGFVDTIKREEEELITNQKDQKEETTDRRKENEEYQVNIKNLVIAQDMLTESVNVLKAYYEEMAAHPLNSFLQVSSKDAPAVADAKYTGQDTKVIGMIEGIMKEAADEEALAHQSEGAAQQAFEDSMKLLTEQEESLRKSLEENKVALATAEQDHISREKEKDATEKELAAVEAFLHEIKPTCDFMEANYDLRKASRVKETEALNSASGMIKASPAYVAAEEKANSQR
eukprot:TRINITY_DN4664_c5_g2_i1.p1 TRINITY_DN4664_c5_g2~~TRINITY_DN4664_c5_g2_i1.p1  ORF type:complete len:680 (-),score=249.95 TRINITY_DN4664_c5_g2_i1:60-2099(-)